MERTISKTMRFNWRSNWIGATVILMILCSLGTSVKGQSNPTGVEPAIQQKSQQDLLNIRNLLVGSVNLISGKSMMQTTSIQGVSGDEPTISKDEALMEILIYKNQILAVDGMPAPRLRMNIESILGNLKRVLSDTEYKELTENQELMKQLGLVIEDKDLNP